MSYITVGGQFADVGGNNNNSGGARLSGKYVEMRDDCGNSFMEGNNINWGTSGGSNCKFNSIQQLYQKIIIFVLIITHVLISTHYLFLLR